MTKENTVTPKDVVPAEPAAAPEGKVASEASVGAQIADAISQGLEKAQRKTFVIEQDKGVQHRFSLVRNADGEVMLRENNIYGTGESILSKLQLKSLEEKQAEVQNQEVTEI